MIWQSEIAYLPLTVSNNVINTLKRKNLNGVPQSVLYKYVVIAGLDLDESATDGEKQAVMNARTILKYTSQKRAWIKDLLELSNMGKPCKRKRAIVTALFNHAGEIT